MLVWSGESKRGTRHLSLFVVFSPNTDTTIYIYSTLSLRWEDMAQCRFKLERASVGPGICHLIVVYGPKTDTTVFIYSPLSPRWEDIAQSWFEVERPSVGLGICHLIVLPGPWWEGWINKNCRIFKCYLFIPFTTLTAYGTILVWSGESKRGTRHLSFNCCARFEYRYHNFYLFKLLNTLRGYGTMPV